MWGGNELMAQEPCSSSHQHIHIHTNLGICFMSDLGSHWWDSTRWKQGYLDRPSSLECLLSATTNNINISTEDDEGISVLFSDCLTLWSFGGVLCAACRVWEQRDDDIDNNKAQVFEEKQRHDVTSVLFTTIMMILRNSFKLIYYENQSKSKKPRT